MAAFDSVTQSLTMNMNVPREILHLSAPDSAQHLRQRMDAFDHDIDFEAGDLLSVFSPLQSIIQR